MPTTLVPVTITRAGSDLTTLAAAADVAGNNWANTGSEFLFIKNASVGAITLTLAFGPGAVVDGVTPASHTVSLTAAHEYLIGPFPTTIYNDINGLMQITFSGVTTLTLAVFTYTPNT